MDKKQKILFGAACALGGVVIGFLIAPVKKGVCCGNGNGNNLFTKEAMDKFLENCAQKTGNTFNEDR